MSFQFQVYTVSQLTRELKLLIEDSYPPIRVEGEISNFKHHSSGHMYFSLKDEGASLRCVFFRQSNLRLVFRPEDGMKVLAFGELSVYEPSGQYQLKVAELKPRGVGELQLAFEQLKARLQEEGLFDPERKKEIPSFPRVVGVVTSPTGAAVRDIISVISRRSPFVRIVLCPVRVQGEGAAREIAAAMETLAGWGEADVIITGRGGGSIEDLWAFNTEEVARAIYDCPVPVVSAVGHETDFTIADFVADLRAPTPSAAAEVVAPDATELKADLTELARRLSRAVKGLIESHSQRLDEAERGLSPGRVLERLGFFTARRDSIEDRLKRATLTRLNGKKADWQRLLGKLSALNPAAVLDRGFSVVRTPTGKKVRDAAQVKVGDALEVILSRGRLGCSVETVKQKNESIIKDLPEPFCQDRPGIEQEQEK